MNNSLSENIKKLVLQLMVIQLIALFAIAFLFITFNHYSKQQLAKATATAVRNNILINDMRETILTTKRITEDHFFSVELFNDKNKSIFRMPTNVKRSTTDEVYRNKSYIYSYIEEDIYLNRKDKIQVGTLKFIYNRLEYLQYIVGLWIFFLIACIPFVAVARKKIEKNHQRDLELQESYIFGQSAKEWAHDLKNFSKIMDFELKKIKYSDEESKKIVVLSMKKIDKTVHKILGRGKTLMGIRQNNDEIKQAVKNQLCANMKEVRLASSLPRIVDEYNQLHHNVKCNVKINLDISENCQNRSILVDEGEFQRVIKNILTNAVEALSEMNVDGKINITCNVDDNNNVHIQFNDNGRGIAQEHINHIMEEGKSFGNKIGNGIGLHHANKCISSWNGTIIVESQEGRGTVVTIKLPSHLRDPSKKLDSILIEDEKLIRLSWDKAFRQNSFNMVSLSTPSEFTAFEGVIDKGTLIFIDSYLGNNVKGEDFAKVLYQKGYNNIYLTTSADKFDYEDAYWFKGIIGKSPVMALGLLK